MEKAAFIAPDADIIGDVELAEDVSIWYHATLRADSSRIVVGQGSNIQDNCVLHVDKGFPLTIGEGVTVGHGAIVHGCSVGDNTVIGMGAILLNGCRIGKNCIIGAGTLITQGMQVEDGSVVLGNPGRVKRKVQAEEIVGNRRNAEAYIEKAGQYREGKFGQ